MQHSHLRLCCTVSNHVCAKAPALPCSSGSEASQAAKAIASLVSKVYYVQGGAGSWQAGALCTCPWPTRVPKTTITQAERFDPPACAWIKAQLLDSLSSLQASELPWKAPGKFGFDLKNLGTSIDNLAEDFKVSSCVKSPMTQADGDCHPGA